jgi:hypothetical protein
MLSKRSQPDPLKILALYYCVTGVWPIVHLRSFYAVTGRKSEGWLVQTFGALICGIGAVLLGNPPREGRRIQESVAAAAGGALIASEVAFVARRRISPIYLADAALETLLLLALRRRRADTHLE